MVTYITKGDIFCIEGVKCYAHGCNCAGAMGKGIALQFKARYPQMYKEYRERCLDGRFTLGDVFEYIAGEERVYNLGTERHWRLGAELEAIRCSLDKMLKLAVQASVATIALPRIGAGLGKLDWNDVKRVIEEVAAQYPQVNLVVVENYEKGDISRLIRYQ